MKHIDKQTFDKLQKEIEELRELPGQQRGEHVKYYVNYVKENYGEEGLKKVTDTLKELDVDIGDVEEFADTEWVSETLAHIFFVTSARVLGWSEKEIYEIGREIAPQSTITKVFLRYFPSIKKTLQRGVKQWNNNFTRGELSVEEFDSKNKKGILVLRNFKSHYFAYIHFQGFFSRILELITGSDKVKISEPECINEAKGDWQWEFSW